MSKMPEQPKPPTKKQALQRKRFQQATAYAKAAVEPPDIAKIDLTEYAGSIGDRIQIVVSDNFAVESIRIRITNADGSPVEEGEAVQSEEDVWIYTAAQNNNSLDGGRIEVSASNWQGNVTEESYEL
jgi:hypothetical protein